MSDNLNCKLEFDGVTTVPSFGGVRVEAKYFLTTKPKSADFICKKNVYEITAKVSGLETADLVELKFYDCKAQNNNEDTLTDEAVEQLLIDNFDFG